MSYRSAEVIQTTFTAEDLYKAVHRKELEEDMIQIEQGRSLEEVISDRMKKMDEKASDKQGNDGDDITTEVIETTDNVKDDQLKLWDKTG